MKLWEKNFEINKEIERFTVGRDREEPKCVKFETVQSPVPFNVWVQVLPVDENNSKMKVTVKAELNPFIKGMLEGPMKDGVEKIADALAQVQYT